jgi:hypothetical protein
MKNNIKSVIAIIIFTSLGCVQPAYKKTIVFLLKAPQIKDIKNVVIKGNDKPLSWDNGLEMKLTNTDTTYKAIVTFYTGYRFIEMKFVVNDSYELNDKANRKIYFSEKDTTIYSAVFNELEATK